MPDTHRKIGIHNLIRGFISLGFAVFIAYLVKSGDIHLFIAPRMLILVKISAIGLYLIGAYQLYTAYRHLHRKHVICDDCEHVPEGSLWKHLMIYGLFVLPLLLGVLLPNSTMGSALAAKKGMNLSASASGRILTSAEPEDSPSFLADEYNEDFARLAKKLYQEDVIEVSEDMYMEILTSIDLFMNEFQGKTVELGGFVYREDTMNEKQFVIGRFAMDCCSADALPYGVLVEYDKAGRYEDDAWIRVRGTISKTVYQGQEIMVLRPESIIPISEPETPYIYPNYNF